LHREVGDHHAEDGQEEVGLDGQPEFPLFGLAVGIVLNIAIVLFSGRLKVGIGHR